MAEPSLIKYFRDILIFPVVMTTVVPYMLYDKQQVWLPDNVVLKSIAVCFFIAGLSLFFWTNYLFRTIAKGTLAPWSVKQKLVISGPYKYCRNPMITGVLFILIGETLFLHSTNIMIWTCFFFTMQIFYFALIEEPGLYERFGDEYKTYKENVPRWIPRLTPYSGMRARRSDN